jgi:L-aminopeptidase/D-esterase-like protein
MEKILPKGIKIGHANDDHTGVTVILCEEGATGGADVRGGAPGTHETDLIRSEKMMQKINAVTLCGGSAYGLGTIAGVMDCLKKQGIGYKVEGKVVPIVPGAVIFDLIDKEYHYPDFEMGYKAASNAVEDNVISGRIGAGRGATVGKIRGIKYADKGGLGIGTVKVQGIIVTALIVVNALGDIYDHDNKIIAGARDNKGGFLNIEKTILEGDFMRLIMGTNTTIGCIMTDARISKVEANKLASIGHNGLALSIRPVHTDYDGDTLFCLATGKKKVLNFMLLETAAVEAVRLAVEDAVKSK